MTAATLSLFETAERLGLDPGASGTAGYQRVYKMVTTGHLRAVRVGRTLRVPMSALDEFLAGDARRSA